MHHTTFSFLGSLVLATLTSAAPLAEPQAAPSASQEPLQDYTPHQQTPQDIATIDALGFHPDPGNPHNTTCNATDTACVTGVQPVSVSKRHPNLEPTRIDTDAPAPEAEFMFAREAAPEEPHEHERRQAAQGLQEATGITEQQQHEQATLVNSTTEKAKRQSQTLQQAADSAGITRLRNQTDPVPSGNGNTTPQPTNDHPAPGAGGLCKASDVSCVVGAVKGKIRRGFRGTRFTA